MEDSIEEFMESLATSDLPRHINMTHNPYAKYSHNKIVEKSSKNFSDNTIVARLLTMGIASQ